MSEPKRYNVVINTAANDGNYYTLFGISEKRNDEIVDLVCKAVDRLPGEAGDTKTIVNAIAELANEMCQNDNELAFLFMKLSFTISRTQREQSSSIGALLEVLGAIAVKETRAEDPEAGKTKETSEPAKAESHEGK